MNNTDLVSTLLLQIPDSKTRVRLNHFARRGLINYLSCYLQGMEAVNVERFSQYFGIDIRRLGLTTTTNLLSSSQRALLYGFVAHYLDLDDVQANFRSHPSAVIYSALLAVSNPNDRLEDLLWAYISGVEFAGQLGKLLNPNHAIQGWHSTGTIGSLAAAAAIGVYRNVTSSQLSAIISLASTQASGQLSQEGSDGKPLNAGFAARNAVCAYSLVSAGFSANRDPLANQNSWFSTLSQSPFNQQAWIASWMHPGQIESPGLWFKTHAFCSAALSGYDAAKQAWKEGIKFSDCNQIIVHYPPHGDAALTQTHPKMRLDGKFSIEYIIWQVLTKGDVHATDFANISLTSEEQEQLTRIVRQHDLPIGSPTQRPVSLELIIKSKVSRFDVKVPHGSPEDPLTDEEIINLANKSSEIHFETIQTLLNNSHQSITRLLTTINHGQEDVQ